MNALGFDPVLTSSAAQQGVGISHGIMNEVSFSFAVSPVPEPEAWAMLIAGLTLVGWAARRRSDSPR